MRSSRRFETLTVAAALAITSLAAGQSMFRPHREAAITGIATDHEPR
jgi:hypothetical protein